MSAARLALAAAVLYAVLKRRVFDLSFAVSKTLVYRSSPRSPSAPSFLLLEVCVALGFGIWLNAMHNGIDHFVDRVLFRRRHLAEVTIETCDALDLSSAAVFRKDGERTSSDLLHLDGFAARSGNRR